MPSSPIDRPHLSEPYTVAAAVAIALAATLAYLPTLNDWFFADDLVLLRSSQTTGWPEWLRQSWDFRTLRIADIVGYRPL